MLMSDFGVSKMDGTLVDFWQKWWIVVR